MSQASLQLWLQLGMKMENEASNALEKKKQKKAAKTKLQKMLSISNKFFTQFLLRILTDKGVSRSIEIFLTHIDCTTSHVA